MIVSFPVQVRRSLRYRFALAIHWPQPAHPIIVFSAGGVNNTG
jgi:hypothetical protein